MAPGGHPNGGASLIHCRRTFMGVCTTTSPVTGETLATFEEISDAELQDLIARSDAAYRSWRTTSPDERRAGLARAPGRAVRPRAAEIHRERAGELAALLTLEMGKPATQAQGEVALVASIYQ